MSEQEFVQGRHVGGFPCPLCNSTDNLQVWIKQDENGVDYYDGKCFTPSCKAYWGNNELVEQGVITGEFTVDKSKLKEPKKRPTPQEAKILARDLFKRTVAPENYRGIRKETFLFFGDRAEVDTNGNISRIWYAETYQGEVQGFKPRTLPKVFGFPNIGFTGSQNDLSGQWKFPNGGRFVVIVGGENDRSAAFQMLRDYQINKNQEDYDPIAVVSPTCGEGSAANQCRRQYDWFDKFDNIIVGMDNDEAGWAATEEIVKVLPKDKVKVATWSLKDPHKMLEERKEKQFISNFWDAKEVTPTGIKSSKDLMEDVAEVLTATPITLPPYMHKLEKAMKRAFSMNGRVVNLVGSTSVGKSTHVNAMVYHWAMSEHLKPLVISLEMTGGEYAIDLLSLHLGKNLDWFDDGQDALDYLEHPDVKPLYANLMQDEYGVERFRIVDEGITSLPMIEKQIDRAVKQYGCNIVIIDVLSDILRFLPLEEQERHMAWQKNFVKSGVSILNVLHCRKLEKDKEGKQRFATEFDALGSSSFVQSAHINIVLNRDKMAECMVDRNTTYVDMPKCRRGTTGRITEWVYDLETRQVYDKDDYINKEVSQITIEQLDNPPLNDNNEEVIF